jgi:hypothetical protein
MGETPVMDTLDTLTVNSFQNSGYMGILFLFTKIREIYMILKFLG